MSLLKQWKERATGLFREYNNDLFTRARVQIIAFQTIKILFIVWVVSVLFASTQEGILTAASRAIESALDGSTIASQNILSEAISQAEINKQYVLAAIVGLTVMFSFVMTRIYLRPLEISLRAQKSFIASIAHEIRTPLAVMKLDNELLKQDLSKDSVEREVVNNNIEEINRINSIVNNLLLFNRVDSSESIKFDKVDTDKLLRSVCNRLRKLADKKNINLICDPRRFPTVYGNYTGLEQVFFNLIKNAINYSLPNTTVKVNVSAISDEQVTVSVVDKGIGIEKEALRHIFEPFYRSPNKLEEIEGSGLGLAIVFEIVKLHKGAISVKSKPGVGSMFFVSLPRRSDVTHIDETMGDAVTFDFGEESRS